MRRRSGLGFVMLAAVVASPGWAAAQDVEVLSPTVEPAPEGPGPVDVELTVEVGALDRGTTGVGAPLLGYGWDHGGGLLVGVGTRAYVALNEYFSHGPALRLTHQAGGLLGLVGGVGFAWTQIDTTYAFRTLLPCMSEADRQWHLTGLVGLTTVRADAGSGTGPRDERWNERQAASSALDHWAVGPLLGVGLDATFGRVLVGATVDVREPFALGDVPISRSFVTTAALRTGVALDL